MVQINSETPLPPLVPERQLLFLFSSSGPFLKRFFKNSEIPVQKYKKIKEEKVLALDGVVYASQWPQHDYQATMLTPSQTPFARSRPFYVSGKSNISCALYWSTTLLPGTRHIDYHNMRSICTGIGQKIMHNH